MAATTPPHHSPKRAIQAICVKSAPWLCVVVSHHSAKAILSIVTGAPPGTIAGAYSACTLLGRGGPFLGCLTLVLASWPWPRRDCPFQPTQPKSLPVEAASSSECLPARSFEFYFSILFSVCAPQHTCGSQGVANRNQSFLPSNGPRRPLSGPRHGLSVVAGGYWLVIHASGGRHCRVNLKKRSHRAPWQKR